MEKPSNLLLKLGRRLFDNQDERERFIEALLHPQPFNPCILWCQEKPAMPFAVEQPTPWQPPLLTAYLWEKDQANTPCMSVVITTAWTSLLFLLLLSC